jgi:RNA polymerase sigma-70 factor, ECF subfamily
VAPTHRNPDFMTDQVRKETFLALYEPVHLSFQRFCRARAHSADNAKDLIAETVLKAYEGIHRLRDEKAFLAFLFGIASRIIKKQYRRQKFWGFFDYGKSYAIEDKGPTPEQGLDVQFLYDAIKKLPLKYQEAVVLHFISGFSLQEVAVIQESTLSAVKLRVLRGKIKLRKILKLTEVPPSENKKDANFKITQTML